MNLSLTGTIGVHLSITKFRVVAPISSPPVGSDTEMHGTGTLVTYVRFVDVQQRRARISEELAASDPAWGGEDLDPARPKPRS